jgi:hypothetical protein
LTGGQEYCPYLSTSPATFLAAAIVIEARLGDPGGRELDLWLHRAELEILPVDAEQADMARTQSVGLAALGAQSISAAGTTRAAAIFSVIGVTFGVLLAFVAILAWNHLTRRRGPVTQKPRLLAAETTIPAVVWIVTLVGGRLTLAFGSLLGVPSLAMQL